MVERSSYLDNGRDHASYWFIQSSNSTHNRKEGETMLTVQRRLYVATGFIDIPFYDEGDDEVKTIHMIFGDQLSLGVPPLRPDDIHMRENIVRVTAMGHWSKRKWPFWWKWIGGPCMAKWPNGELVDDYGHRIHLPRGAKIAWKDKI